MDDEEHPQQYSYYRGKLAPHARVPEGNRPWGGGVTDHEEVVSAVILQQLLLLDAVVLIAYLVVVGGFSVRRHTL